MRNVKAYVEAGRSNPSDPQQMREHPYDFVSLPTKPETVKAQLHHHLEADQWNGKLRLLYRTLGPLHVGSGFFEMAQECGLEGSGPVRGIMRSVSGRILPGSSWKGAVRSRYEAITRSCLALVRTGGKEHGDRMPRALYVGKDKQSILIKDLKVDRLESRSVDASRLARGQDLLLSPAVALFGGMGYRGRVSPCDGPISGGEPEEPLQVAPLDSPQRHRLAKPGKLTPSGQNRWVIEEVEGRKFYYDGDLVPKRDIRKGRHVAKGAYDLLDWVAPGAEIDIEIRIRSASRAELGALLVAAGHGDDVGVMRFGGYKSVGLGKVELSSIKTELWRGAALGKRHLEDFDVEAAVQEARTPLIDTEALGELHRITTAWRAE